MRNKILCGLAALALAAGTMVLSPGQSEAQLFNTNKRKDAPAAAGTTGDKTKPPRGSVFNHSGNTQRSSTAPVYGTQKPTGMQARTVPQKSNAGFSARAAGGESAQDRAIREAAMRRLAAGEAAQAAVLADAARLSMSDNEMRSLIENGGEVEEDTRPQIYDKHRNPRNPEAPPRLFNSAH